MENKSSDTTITIGNRILFVGIISQTIVRNKETFLNLGIAIKSTAMLEKLKDLIDLYHQK